MNRKLLIISLALAGCGKANQGESLNDQDSVSSNQIVTDSIVADENNEADGDYSRYDEPLDEEKINGIKDMMVDDDGLDSSMIQVIESESVLFIKPLPEMIKNMDPDDYSMGKAMSEPFFKTTEENCKALNINIVDVNRRYIQLEGVDKSRVLDITLLDRKWEIIMFNPERTPKISANNIPSADELKYFFAR